ncbi:hypothetical protein NM208_g3292 [Fusarium decemcellulare]|uniref:Uncharacterized protein n=1 Tax=Fusarium decemcellulare TaxID=57161 RepID=A0ACC1SPT3_9HYPO|nr:hypothetical protein NM208_g3292 [Fusarium decemcellulare]
MRWRVLGIFWLATEVPVMAEKPIRLPIASPDLTRRQIIGTEIVDSNPGPVCDTLDAEGELRFGDLAWTTNNMDSFMVEHVKLMRLDEGNDLSELGGWTGAFFNLFAIGDTTQRIRCLTTDPLCNVPRKCDGYNDVRYAMGSIAISNIHAILSAQINAYNKVIEKYNAKWVKPSFSCIPVANYRAYSDQELVRSLFKDLEFPKTRGFDLDAFLSGFFLGVDLALGGLTSSFTVAIRSAIKTGLEASKQFDDAAVEEAIPEVNLSKDGKPVIDKLRQSRDALQAILFSWNMRGVADPALEFVSAEETVEFFEGGAFLKPIPAMQDMIDTYAFEIENQMNAQLAASMWVQQDIRRACSGGRDEIIHCVTGGGCSDRNLLTKAPGFEVPLCVELGNGSDLPDNFLIKCSVRQTRRSWQIPT